MKVIGSSDGKEYEINYEQNPAEGQGEALEIAGLKKEIENLEKENIILSRELLKVADQLREWSSEMNLKGYSLEYATPMLDLAGDIRQTVRGTKFFRKENDDD